MIYFHDRDNLRAGKTEFFGPVSNFCYNLHDKHSEHSPHLIFDQHKNSQVVGDKDVNQEDEQKRKKQIFKIKEAYEADPLARRRAVPPLTPSIAHFLAKGFPLKLADAPRRGKKHTLSRTPCILKKLNLIFFLHS